MTESIHSLHTVAKLVLLVKRVVFLGENSYLHLIWADVELAEDVAEEVLDLVPWVDAVGAVQHDDDVHVRGAPCQRVAGSEKSLVPNIIISYLRL